MDANGYEGAVVVLLQQLGYDGREPLREDLFAGLFGLPSVRVQAFLDWLITSVQPRMAVRHRLTGDLEYALYKALVAGEHGGLLDGKALDHAEMTVQADRLKTEDESLDDLLAGNSALEQEIRVLEQTLQLAHDKNDKLAKLVQQKTIQVDSQAAAQDASSSTVFNQSLPSAVSQTDATALAQEVDAILSHLSSDESTNLLSSQANQSIMDSTARQWRQFLYQQSLDSLLEKEADNLREIKERIVTITASTTTSDATKLQEHAATASSANPKDVEAPAWLHESDPLKLHLQERDVQIYNKCSVELARLEKAFVVGEIDALQSQMQLAKAESHWQYVSQTRRFLRQQYQLMSADAVHTKRLSLVRAIDRSKQDLHELVQNKLPSMLEEIAFLQSTTILLGSYEQKLWRQENRFLKLRAVLECVDQQYARLKLVHQLFDAEWSDTMQIESALQQISQYLNAKANESQQRRALYAMLASDGASSDLVQRTLPDMDELAHMLYAIFQQAATDQHSKADENETNTASLQSGTRHSFRFRTFDELERYCERVQANQQSVEQELFQLEHEWAQLFSRKRQTLDSLRRELFGDLTSSTPMVLPETIAKSLQEAVASNEQSEQKLHQALESLRLHKRALEVDPSKRAQQEADFERLKRELDQQQ